jgi:hypothetical protein
MRIQGNALDKQFQCLPEIDRSRDFAGHQRKLPQHPVHGRGIQRLRFEGQGGIELAAALAVVLQVDRQTLSPGIAAPLVVHIHGVERRDVKGLLELWRRMRCSSCAGNT